MYDSPVTDADFDITLPTVLRKRLFGDDFLHSKNSLT
jgi:hypothetical protein